MAKKSKALLKRKPARTRAAPAKRAAPRAVESSFGVAPSFPLPALKPGEVYAGIVIDPATGALSHLVEIARNEKEMTQAEQIDWAKSVGGQIPDKSEGFVLLANRRHAFKKGWYWTREPYAGNRDSAWIQTFVGGHQGNDPKGYRYLACAVRRVAIDHSLADG